MGYLEVADEASRYTGKLGTFMFFISGGGVALNYYIPDLIPLRLIGGMYSVLSLSVLGMVWIYVQHLKNPHYAIGEKCPKCQKSLLTQVLNAQIPDATIK